MLIGYEFGAKNKGTVCRSKARRMLILTLLQQFFGRFQVFNRFWICCTPAMKNAQFWTLLTCLTALLDKRHRMVIEYLKEENGMIVTLSGILTFCEV